MKKLMYLIVLALVLSLVLTGCLLSNVGQVPTTEQSGVAYLTKSGSPPNLFNLVGLWHFDTDANDSSGNNNHGTLIGDAHLNTGYFGNAVSFDGNGDYVEVPDSDSLRPSNVTVECWVKSNTVRAYQYIVAKYYTSGYASYGLYTGGSKGLFFYVSDGSYALSENAGIGVWDGEWHHIAGTYDGSTLRLYVDGIEVGTGKAVAKTIGYSTDNLYIGTYGTNPFFNFTGLIDEVRIWNRALTKDQLDSVIVAMDIKPQSCPNPLNVKNQGVLPVAILGTDDFDVNDIDPSKILLKGVPPLRWAFEDVATPSVDLIDVNEPDCSLCTDGGPDGYEDLTLKFDTQAVLCALGYCATALVEEIEVTINNGDCLVLTLIGELNDKTLIMGKDVVLIIKKGK